MSEAYIDDLLDELSPEYPPAGSWDEVIRRARRGRRRGAALVAALVTLVLVPSALAFGGRILDLFEGTPGPPQIQESFTRWNAGADQMNTFAAQQGFTVKVPHADPSTAHGVLQLQTGDGPLDLWAANSDSGGTCWFYDWESDLNTPGPPIGGGSCDAATPPASGIRYETDWIAAHPSELVVVGRVYTAAATVKAQLDDGSTATLPIVEGLFVGALDANAKLTSITAYDNAGNPVAQEAMP